MKKYLIKYKWQYFLLFLLLVLTSGVSTGYDGPDHGGVQYRFDFWQQYFVLYSK